MLLKPIVIVSFLSLLPPLVLAQPSSSQVTAKVQKFQNGGLPQHGDGQLPQEWAPDKNILWKSPIPGYGQSTPVLLGNQMILTSTSGEKKESCHVLAYQIDTGKKSWQVDLKNPTPYANTPMVSRAAPSCVALKDTVIAFFEGGLLACISANGDVTWQRNLVKEYGPIDARHGLSASLESDGERVFVWVERSDKPYILAVDPATGQNLWKTKGVGATSWGSPRIIPVEGGSQLVCSAIGKIIGVDPATGSQLWEFDGIANNSSNTPIPVAIGQFLIGASEGRGQASSGNAADNNGMIEVRRDANDRWVAAFKWRAEKASSSFGSPVIAGDTAAFVNRAGVLYRLDLATGEQKSVSRTSAGGIWATPIVVQNMIYLFGYKGTTSVISLDNGNEISANRCWPELSDESSIGFGAGKVLYSAILAGDKIIVRSGDMLYAIANSLKDALPAKP
jgi:outer membrane protein assembly factor BamB